MNRQRQRAAAAAARRHGAPPEEAHMKFVVEDGEPVLYMVLNGVKIAKRYSGPELGQPRAGLHGARHRTGRRLQHRLRHIHPYQRTAPVTGASRSARHKSNTAHKTRNREMTDTNVKRQPPSPAEVQERLNRQHGATVPGAAAKLAELAAAKVDENNLTQVAKLVSSASLTAPEQASVFQQYADAAAPRNIVGKLLKFSKGDYVAGEGGEEIKEGTQLVAIMDELWTGWTRWENNKPVESRIGRVVDKFVPPQRRELGDDNKDEWIADERGEARDPWQFGNYLVLKNAETGEFFTFTTGTRGGLNAVADLCRHYARDIKQHPDCYPVIALKSDSYNHPNKAYGRIKIPVFTVVGRATKDGSAVVQAIADDMNDEVPF